MVWRVASYVINVVGSATSQISSAVAIMSYIRSAATATYSEVALLMSSVDSLAAFTRTATGIARTFASLEEGGRYIRTLVAPDKDSHIRREATASPTPVLLEGWRVGSGKTSLMLALCGEMPWTFRENVLMGEPYDEKLYRRVIHACALTHDLEHMDAGDATLIGEGGVKLSGGQKVRLALASLFLGPDIYIFDDLLAAVDAHVERHLVEHVLSAEGIIGTKTRILVTHAMHVVPLSNRVVTLSNGRVEIATQTPAPLARVTNDAAKHGAIKPGIRPDSAAEAKRQPLVQLETGSEPVPAVMVKLASFCAMFYADRLRFSLMGDSNPDTMVQSLQRYLAVNALVGVGPES
ncbi:ATP-binding cassette glutathione S-conjugate transporter ycf1 [Coemansia javaensis]|uniref:ATP-binding cassette glutathione S-conjugate transporter ycf1 n=1 Tax=Coemansia javaensis TaxID=2761396 RepID=A0A9W8H7Y0_9FUNG|nr:ATP-binding cassette glutathione S-conjugate transporter ycf1 [Coemansia javaensis]